MNKKVNAYTGIAIVLKFFLLAALSPAMAADIVRPENVMTANCLKSYHTTYLRLKNHKAFAYAREEESGKDRCGWSYGYQTVDEARNNSLKQCAKSAIKAECKVLDVDGTFITKKDDFSPVTPVDNTPLGQNKKQELMSKAGKLLQGNCLGFFEGYLKDTGHKVFSYSLDSDGKYACGKSRKYNLLQQAEKGAIDACNKNKQKRGKKQPKSPCRIYAKNHDIVLSAKDLGVTVTPKRDRYLDKDEYREYLSQAREIIDGGPCLSQLKFYLRSSQHLAFYLALDSNGKQACGWTKRAFSTEAAKQIARDKCRADLIKKKISAECKLFAQNFDMVGKPEDFGIKKGEDDYRRAIFKGNLSKIKKYVSDGADVNLVSSDGTSSLFVAAGQGDETFFHVLIEKGADIKQKANDGSTLLIAAVMGGNPNLVRYLLDKGFDINTRSREENTPLHVAFGRFDTYLIELLMQNGADPTIKNADGVSGYDLGKKWKVDLDTLKTFDITRKKDGCSPVLYAAKAGDIKRLEKLAALKANMNQACDNGWLVLSSAKNDEKVIRTLVKLGSDINAANADGETALMDAVNDGKNRVKLLLSLGADKSIKDKNGRTAYERVKDRKTVGTSVKELLKP